MPRSKVLKRSEDPVTWLRNNWTAKKRMSANWEPDWHVPGQAIRAAQLLRVENFTTIFNALSAITITDQLRYTRNAVTHALPATYKMYRQTAIGLGYPRNTRPVDFVYFRLGSTGPMLIDHWISELTLCLSAAIK
ncbi:MAG: hypothetical protein A2W09_03815 [Deltaproteobacteria bacterium RBG_16_50_11]|nr:MAG: hypothetical protein A2W09_03815 [Deltaproteobacteria bacterium RBG_16_50_11]